MGCQDNASHSASKAASSQGTDSSATRRVPSSSLCHRGTRWATVSTPGAPMRESQVIRPMLIWRANSPSDRRPGAGRQDNCSPAFTPGGSALLTHRRGYTRFPSLSCQRSIRRLLGSDLSATLCGGIPGSSQSVSVVCVKWTMNSSTIVSVPTVRLIGVRRKSGGLTGMKW